MLIRVWIICCLALFTVAGCGGTDGSADAGLSDDGGDGYDTGDGSDGGGADTPNGDEVELPEWPPDRDLTCEQVKSYVDSADPRLLPVNVADASYYDQGHIAGSLLIPWDDIGSRLDEVDESKHVLLYCFRGVRSEAAYTTLSEAGYANLWVMTGGIERWNELGYPTEP